MSTAEPAVAEAENGGRLAADGAKDKESTKGAEEIV